MRNTDEKTYPVLTWEREEGAPDYVSENVVEESVYGEHVIITTEGLIRITSKGKIHFTFDVEITRRDQTIVLKEGMEITRTIQGSGFLRIRGGPKASSQMEEEIAAIAVYSFIKQAGLSRYTMLGEPTRTHDARGLLVMQFQIANEEGEVKPTHTILVTLWKEEEPPIFRSGRLSGPNSAEQNVTGSFHVTWEGGEPQITLDDLVPLS